MAIEFQPSSPVTIEQTTGPKRAMVFKGPAGGIYRPLQLPRIQRVVTIFNPGSPTANQQVLGPTFEPTIIRGSWKDKRLGLNNEANGVDLLNFPPLSPGALSPTGVASGSSFVGTAAFPARQPAKLARVVADAVELMLAEGQQIRFAWDQYVRYGVIKRFVPDWERINDVFWEIELEWSGNTDSPPIKRKVSINVLATASGLQAILQALLAILAKLAGLRNPNAFLSKLANGLAAIVALVEGVVGALRAIGNIKAAPSNVLSSIKSALWQIRLLVRGLLSELGRARGAAGEAASVGAADATAIAAAVQQELRARLLELAAFAAAQQRLADLFTTDELLATFTAQTLTSLYDVASQYYGDPTRWSTISEYNAFYAVTVPRGTLVRVPRI